MAKRRDQCRWSHSKNATMAPTASWKNVMAPMAKKAMTPERNPLRPERCGHNAKSSWLIMTILMIHHHESSRTIHHDSSWGFIMMNHCDLWWRVITIHHCESWYYSIVKHHAALKGFLWGCYGPCCHGCHDIFQDTFCGMVAFSYGSHGMFHAARAPMAFFYAETFNMG